MTGLDADFKAFLDATSNPSESRPATAEEQQRRRDQEETKPGSVFARLVLSCTSNICIDGRADILMDPNQ